VVALGDPIVPLSVEPPGLPSTCQETESSLALITSAVKVKLVCAWATASTGVTVTVAMLGGPAESATVHEAKRVGSACETDLMVTDAGLGSVAGAV
jgi:hypothetical protein